MLDQLGLSQGQPIDLLLLGDNQSSLALAKNPEFHARTKHIDVMYHFVREQVEHHKIRLVYCPTADMLADGFTKPLNRQHFQGQFKRLSLIGLANSGAKEASN